MLFSWRESLGLLQMEHLDYSVLQIIKTLNFNCCFALTENQNLQVKNAMCQYLLSLLQKVVSNRSFDLQLGLVCLFMLPKDKSFKWFPNELQS